MNIDRDTAARLGITVSQIDNTLYDAFGQRQVSTIYVARNQYHVVMEVAPRILAGPADIAGMFMSAPRPDRPAAHRPPTRWPERSPRRRRPRQPARSRPARYAIKRPTRSAPRARRHASTGTAVSTNQETMIPLSSVAALRTERDAAVVNHQDVLVANTISFNLPPGVFAEHGGCDDRGDHEPDRSARDIRGSFSRASPRFSRNHSAANRF